VPISDKAGELHLALLVSSSHRLPIIHSPRFPVPVEIGAGVDYAEWNQQRALQVVAEEWEVRGI
jgi:hypothetical protein